MSEYMVEVGLDLQADSYITSMGQAINLTKQYADVASGVPGAVQNLSQQMVKATSAVTGFNKMQTVAIDTAAAYEKQLSNIQAKTTLTGQSFEKLSKTTKSWAREFPVGMGEATKVMETLQKQGIKSEKAMGDLGKSMLRLGAATNSAPAAMGEQFLQLSKTMGNGIGQFEKLSDSLVSVTAKVGGSAAGVVAFSKALAPVAATVGMSQTAVMGLSTAMSKLGEDGGYAASSLNKVMLDMNRAMRDGGPELKAYSDLLGMTSNQMREMFKQNPAELIARFSESVAKAGPDVTRSLEALGFDSVRTTRSLTALARSGDVRGAVNESIAAYGNGSTEKAATEAFDGLTDSAERLRETMGQVVQDVGQPMIGLAKGLLAPVNMVASGVQSATSSSVGQGVLGAAGVGGFAAGVGGNIVAAATMVKLGSMLYDGVIKPKMVEPYQAGVQAGRAGGPMPGGAAGTLGYARGASAFSTMGAGLANNQSASISALGKAANNLAKFSTEGFARYQAATANFLGGPKVGVTPLMQEQRGVMGGALRAMWASAGQADMAGLKDSTKTLSTTLRDYAKGYGQAAGGAPGSLARGAAYTAMLPVRGAAALGAVGMRAAGGLMSGMSAMGFNPAMLGVMGVAAGGMYLAGKQGESNANRDRIYASNMDLYMRFNDFAEATGKASKGVVAFQERVENTTQTLVDANKTWEQALNVNPQELAQSRASGYVSTTPFFGDSKTVESLTFAAQTTLGTAATMEDVARVMMDVAHIAEGNPELIKGVVENLSKTYGPNAVSARPVDMKAFTDLLYQNASRLPVINEAQTEIAISASTAVGREGAEAASRYGGTLVKGDVSLGAEEATRYIRAQEFFDAAKNNKQYSGSGAKAAQEALAAMLGVEADDIGMGTGNLLDPAKIGNYHPDTTLIEALYSSGTTQGKDLATRMMVLEEAGIKSGPTGAIDYGKAMMSEMSPAQKETKSYLSSLGSMVGGGSQFKEGLDVLTKSLFTASEASIKFGKSTENLSAADAIATGGSPATLSAVQNSGDAKKVQEAINSVMADFVKASGGNFTQAQFAGQMAASEAPIGTERQIIEGVLQQMEGSRAIATAGKTNAASLLDQVQVGRQAAMAPTTNNNVSVATSTVLGGQMAQGQLLSSMADINRAYGGMQAQIAATQRSAGVSAGAARAQGDMAIRNAREDYEIQQRYARQDYRTQRRYAREDFNTTQSRAREDYGITRARMERDMNTQVERAERDFAKQMTRAEEDFYLQRGRAFEDFGVQRERATRDFNLSIFRAQRDYEKSSARAEEDYLKSRGRAVEDFNKSMKRSVEDAVKSMYDPFKRIQAAMVMDAGQLLTNLKDQQRALDKQVGDLAKARSMGVTEETIKALSLADAQNAQQLSRLVGDLGGNPDLAAQLNEATSAKSSSAEALFKDQGNTQFARAQEDMATQLARMDEDYATSMARSAADFTVSMSDAQQDFATAMSDSMADFNKSIARMDTDFATSRARATEDFAVSMSDMRADYQKAMDDMAADFDRNMQRAADDFDKQMRRMEKEFKKSSERAADAVELAIKRINESTALQISTIGAGAAAAIQSMEESFFGMFQNSATGIAAAEQFIKIVEGANIPIKDMSDEMQAMYKAAKDLISGAGMLGGYDESQKLSMKQGQPGAGAPAATYDESDKLSMKDGSVHSQIGENYKKIGQAAGAGFIAGIGEAIGNLWDNFWQGLLDLVNIKFKIQSPSKVFKDIGMFVVQGFVEGIATIPATLWNKLTETLPTPAELLTDVKGAFKSAKDWLESFTSEDSPIVKWIGKGWDKLWSTLPKPEDLWTKIKAAFEGDGKGNSFMSFLTGIPEWIGKHLPSASTILGKLDPLKDAFSALFYNIVELFNKLDLKLDVSFPGFDIPPIGKIEVGGKTLFDGFGGKTGLGAFSINLPDLIPDITNPFPAPKVNQALGGIVTKAHNALIGEAGYPEAVIPLNQRGADVLAETMARYVTKGDVQGSQMERYASPTYNYYSTTQDYSTNITGAITVQAQNPDEMAQRLSARAKRARLAQPIGGAR